MNMADEWYYAHDANKIGPFSGQQLKNLAATGHILQADIIWKEGVAKGVLASKVKNLFSLPPARVTLSTVDKALLVVESKSPLARRSAACACPGQPRNHAQQSCSQPPECQTEAGTARASRGNNGGGYCQSGRQQSQISKKVHGVRAKGPIRADDYDFQ